MEISSFEFEFVTLETCRKYIIGSWYKLCLMGVPCDFTIYSIFGDDQSVVVNSSKNFSKLLKSSYIVYHLLTHEKVATR